MDGFLIIANIIFIILLLISSLLTIISLPGNILLLTSMLLYGLYDNFIHLTYYDILIVVVLLIIGEVIEFINGPVLAKAKGASTKTVIFTGIAMIIGGVLGSIVLIGIGSIIGAILSGFLTAFYFEYNESKNIESAKIIAKAIVKGQIIGVLIKFIIVLFSIGFLITKLSWQ